MFRWSRARRLLYAAGSPLIPILRVARSISDIRRTGRGRTLLPQIIPVLLLGTFSGAVGEALGYLLGARPRDVAGRFEIELDRYAFVNRADRNKPKAPRFNEGHCGSAAHGRHLKDYRRARLLRRALGVGTRYRTQGSCGSKVAIGVAIVSSLGLDRHIGSDEIHRQ